MRKVESDMNANQIAYNRAVHVRLFTLPEVSRRLTHQLVASQAFDSLSMSGQYWRNRTLKDFEAVIKMNKKLTEGREKQAKLQLASSSVVRCL